MPADGDRTVALVERFVAARFPLATTAVVGGSAAAGRRTATSDVDVLVIGPPGMLPDGRDALAAFLEFEGQAFDVFAYEPAAFEWWARRDLDLYRPVLVDILLTGLPVRSSPELDDLRERWGAQWRRGPVIDAHQLELRRYLLGDVLDDLGDAVDPLERQVLAADAFARLAELMLLQHGRWTAAGKWLPRRLREWDAVRTDALAAPLLAGDVAGFVAAARAELEALGGPVGPDFVR